MAHRAWSSLAVWSVGTLVFCRCELLARVDVPVENVIRWMPERDTADWLVGRLFPRIRELGRDRVLAQLKGKP